MNKKFCAPEIEMPINARANPAHPPLPPVPLMRAMFEAVIAAAQPARVVPAHLPQPGPGRTIVIAAGKAAGPMARAFAGHWSGPFSGVMVAPEGGGCDVDGLVCLEASHPVPDRRSLAAAEAVMAAIAGARFGDQVIVLISGGGSALLCKPAPGLDLADKQAVHNALLASGAAIGEMNIVRKHLSGIKGGRLVPRHCDFSIDALLMSDVPGDDPSVIASGPTVPDSSTLADARAVIARHGLDVPETVRRALLDPANETPKPDDPRFRHVRNRVILTPRLALDAAPPLAVAAGYEVLDLGDRLEGEAGRLAEEHAALALGLRAQGRRVAILSGGESGVRVSGVPGTRGGRNSHYALALAMALRGASGISALAADTDGIDGRGGHAGAFVTADSLARAEAAGLDPARLLADTNSHAFFEANGDLLVTGPTGTNVNDFRVILVEG